MKIGKNYKRALSVVNTLGRIKKPLLLISGGIIVLQLGAAVVADFFAGKNVKTVRR